MAKELGLVFDSMNLDEVVYNMEVLCDLAKSGIDEVNLDYIRFSTAFFGELRVYTGDEKAARIETFLKMAKQTLDECSGGHTKLGISTFAILGWSFKVNKETLGQDIIRFAPLVDVISPMAYPATFTSPEYYIPGKHPRSRMYWLVNRTLTGYKDFKEQMDAVYDSGACGFTVWNASNNFGPVIKGMATQKIPERCK